MCFTTSLPLMSSSPMLRRPTVGRSMPSTAVASALPITANWTSCAGVQFTLAPRSSAVVTPLRVGNCDAIAGRSMPGSVFSTKRAMAMSAPVLPADTQACAVPSLTRLTATRIDESFFLRSASAGGSSIVTTSLAGRIVMRSGAATATWRAPRRAGSRPTSDHARVGRLLEKGERGRHGDRRTVVAPHRVDGDGDGHRAYRSSGSGVDGRCRIPRAEFTASAKAKLCVAAADSRNVRLLRIRPTTSATTRPPSS